MNYCVITFSGEGLSVAKHLQDEGKNVIVGFIQDQKDILLPEEGDIKEEPKTKKARLSLYEGILKRSPAEKVVEFLKKQKNKEDWFIFFDFNHCFKFAEQLKGLGFKGNFPTAEDRKFEVNREYAKDFIKNNYPDIRVAEEHKFGTLNEAEQFLKDTKDLWVLKPFSDNAKTKVPQSEDPIEAGQELINAIKNDQKNFEDGGFILELKIPECIELTPQKIYYNGVPIFTDLDIELKRIGGEEKGAMTGCSADLVFQTEMEAKINQIAFPSFVDEMAKNHEGMFVWDISLLFDPKTEQVYASEFCPNRVGYNSFYNELCQAKSVSGFFENIVNGTNPLSGDSFGASVRIFSVSQKGIKPDEKIAIDWNKYVWPIDIKKDATAGYLWDVAVITGHDNNIAGAFEEVFDQIGSITFDSMYSRSISDIISTDYFNSIPNRFNFGNGRLWNPIGIESAYDFDGVITAGIVPEEGSAIITGNPESQAPRVMKKLIEINRSQLPVFYFPNENSITEDQIAHDRMVGHFKADKIAELGVRNFFEDRPIQAAIIRQINPNTKVVLIDGGVA